MTLEVKMPFETFRDTDGTPLDAGFVYLGVANLEPIANPISAYWDASLTIPALQPIRTLAGMPSRGGSPSPVYAGADYSIVVQDKKGRLIYSSPSVPPQTYLAPFTGAVARTQAEKNAEYISLTDGVGIDPTGATESTGIQGVLNANAGKTIRVPKGTYLCAPFTIPDYTHLIGEGARVVRIKMKNGANANFISHAGAGGQGVVIEGLTIDGNRANNASGRGLYFITGGTDGPALVLRDVLIEQCPKDSIGIESVFVGGLNWVHFDNVRVIFCQGALWFSTNDSWFGDLTTGGLSQGGDYPQVVIGGGSNRFNMCYFGGNGGTATQTGSQVKLIAAQHNYLFGCINDSANGHAYEFEDYGIPCKYNQIIGGLISSPGQNLTNTYYHVLFRDSSNHNTVQGATIINSQTSVGRFAVVELGSAHDNLIQGCQIGRASFMGTIVGTTLTLTSSSISTMVLGFTLFINGVDQGVAVASKTSGTLGSAGSVYALSGAPSGGNVTGQPMETSNFGYSPAYATIGANNTRILDCPGLTPLGAEHNQTVTASPYTYANSSNFRNLVYIAGGTVSAVTKDGRQIFPGSNVSVWLDPGESVVITYTGVPTVNVDYR